MKGVRRLTLDAMFIALACVIGYVESLIPSFWVPGLKPGLANIVILLIVVEFTPYEALIVDLAKVFLVSLLRGTIFQMGFFMSLTGSLLSLGVMLLAHYCFKRFSLIGVSILGALFHDLGQFIIAWVYLGTAGVFYYLPFVALVSLATGTLVGLLVRQIDKTGIIQKEKAKYERQSPKV
jgi:heptaprenyl diphosphate synthase